MKKLILIVCFAIGLSACASRPNPLTVNELAYVESAYGVALSTAVAYRNLRLCKTAEIASITNICAYRSIILQLQYADRNAQITLKEARAFIKNYPTLDASAYIAAAKTSVTIFQNISTNIK